MDIAYKNTLMRDNAQELMETIVMTVTPEQAKSFLLMNKGNRPLHRSYVAHLAESMKRGDWILTHQGIAFSSDGRLIDGQHRCAAIVSAGIAVPMTITFNAKPESFLVLDTGKKRSASYTLGLDTSIVGAIRWMIALSESETPAGTSRITNQEVERAKEWALWPLERLFEACKTTRKLASSSPSLCGIALRLVASEDKEPVVQAFRAFILLEYNNMPASVQTLERQISSGLINLTSPKFVMAKTFKAFDLEKGETKLAIKDEAATLRFMHKCAATLRWGDTR